MENKYNNYKLFNKDKIQFQKYNHFPKFNFYQNKNNNNNNILINNLNSNRNKIIENKFNNANLNTNLDNNKINNQEEDLLSNKASYIYQKNIDMLNEKIKEQENDIRYLNDRLNNYDTTMNEVTRLNIEVNKLNEIIMEKNYTIQEFKDITELSKNKFDVLLKNKSELIQIIKKLEKENRDLKNNINNFENNFNNMKKDLDDIIKENRELKRQLNEKNQKLENIDNAIEKFNNNRNFKKNINNIKDNINKNLSKNFPKNPFLKDKYNINDYTEIKNDSRFLKERSKTPLLKNFEAEENDIPYQRYNDFKQVFSLRTEPNNNIFNDIKTSYRY